MFPGCIVTVVTIPCAPDVTRHWSPETEHRDSVTRLVTPVTPGRGCFHLCQERAEQSQSLSDSERDNFAAKDPRHLICHEAPQPGGLCHPGPVPVGPTLTLSGLCQLLWLSDIDLQKI